MLGKARHHRDIADAMHGEEIALNYTHMKGEAVKPTELSQALRLSTARIAATLNSLEKKGLITREIDPNNRRQILVRPTDAGREQVERHRRELLEMTAKMLSLLGEEDAREYVRITARLSELMPHPGSLWAEQKRN